MSSLALVQGLFKKVWLPRKPMPMGKPFGLTQKTTVAEAPAVQSAPTPKVVLEASIASRPMSPAQPPKQAPKQILQQSVARAPVASIPEVATLAVEAPEAFHVAATMVGPGWGLVVSLPAQQGGLPGNDYLMLSNMIAALRKLMQQLNRQVDFEFFRWPPGRGVAKGLDVQSMGLSALKGFLHKMASRQQCSWIVLGEEFAQFCFQSPSIQPFDIIPRGEQQLVVSPALFKLQDDPEAKKRLWLLLKSKMHA